MLLKQCLKCKGRGVVGPAHSPWSPCTRCNGNRRKRVKGEDRWTGPIGTGIKIDAKTIAA